MALLSSSFQPSVDSPVSFALSRNPLRLLGLRRQRVHRGGERRCPQVPGPWGSWKGSSSVLAPTGTLWPQSARHSTVQVHLHQQWRATHTDSQTCWYSGEFLLRDNPPYYWAKKDQLVGKNLSYRFVVFLANLLKVAPMTRLRKICLIYLWPCLQFVGLEQ